MRKILITLPAVILQLNRHKEELRNFISYLKLLTHQQDQLVFLVNSCSVFFYTSKVTDTIQNHTVK